MRTNGQIMSELTEINNFLMKGIPDADISQMLHTLSTLVTYLASTAALIGESSALYQYTKMMAYESLRNSVDTNGKQKPASLIKEYVNAKCWDEASTYEFADRVNAAVTHAIEAVRTSVSAEKSLNQAMSYSQTR